MATVRDFDAFPSLSSIRATQTHMSSQYQELFIQYLTEQGHNVVKSERKPRKLIQYKDLG